MGHYGNPDATAYFYQAATSEDTKKPHHRLSPLHHPNKNPANPTTTAKPQSINKAKKTLTATPWRGSNAPNVPDTATDRENEEKQADSWDAPDDWEKDAEMQKLAEEKQAKASRDAHNKWKRQTELKKLAEAEKKAKVESFKAQEEKRRLQRSEQKEGARTAAELAEPKKEEQAANIRDTESIPTPTPAKVAKLNCITITRAEVMASEEKSKKEKLLAKEEAKPAAPSRAEQKEQRDKEKKARKHANRRDQENLQYEREQRKHYEANKHKAVVEPRVSVVDRDPRSEG